MRTKAEPGVFVGRMASFVPAQRPRTDEAIRPTKIISAVAIAAVCFVASLAHGQTAPEIGYMFPSGGQAGTTVDVILGGYDWTPDMQIFVHDPRIKLELTGPPSKVLVPDPPYWFGAKGRGPAWPLPREFPARLTIPADVPPGLVRWQVANANGASPAGFLHVSRLPEIREVADRKGAQTLPPLPVVVSGQIRKIEEIDRYEFSVSQAGPVTIELIARQLASPLHGMLQVTDPHGRVLIDTADTEGRDLAATFRAEAGVAYTLSLHDLDFAGDRSYAYRLALTPGPQVLAAYPAAGRRGETRSVEFVGPGLASGLAAIESVTRDVTFPAAADATSFDFSLDTPHGIAKPFRLKLADAAELVETVNATETTLATLPVAITGSIERRFGSDRFSVALKKGEVWRIEAQARAIGSPLDLDLTVLGPDGQQVATSDDVPGTLDPLLLVTAATDGTHTIVVADRSGKSGDRTANYRLSIEPQREDFSATPPTQLAVVIGGTAKLPLPIVRQGGFKGPVQLQLAGLPAGVTAPADLTIAEGKNDVPIELTCAADAPAGASFCTVTATTMLNGQAVTRQLGTILIAATMKPRTKITPVGLDDVRKVHRGSTYLAPLILERLEGYQGPIVLEMTSKQQRHRQGLASDDFTAPADATNVAYPIFVPEWMETTKTSRMILNGTVQVADPRGNVRTLLNRMELRIGILPEGSLLKLTAGQSEMNATAGGTLSIPLSISRVAEFREPIRIDLIPGDEQRELISAEPLTLAAEQHQATLTVKFAADLRACGEQTLRLRATALQAGRGPVVSESTVLVTVQAAK